MKPRPLASEPLRISGHEALRAADVPIGDLADDLNGLVYSQIDRSSGQRQFSSHAHVEAGMADAADQHKVSIRV
jgi:hypothetical protein